ncbi:MAG: hypothetical protein JKX84_08475 [Flavobacteriales bacterium]|nr:hypothetical protein [Flavobacteriales bacterium]
MSKTYRQNFKNYIEIDSSQIVLIPVSWENNSIVGELKVMGSRRTQNILFYDAENEKYKFLFTDSIQIIHSYSGPMLNRNYQRDTVSQLNDNHLYYSVTNDDFNNDSKLNNNDPKYLYYSKTDGSDLTMLTPKGCHLKYFKYIKSSNIILATLIRDVNNDRSFNDKDSQVLYRVDFNNLNNSKFIVSLKTTGKAK